MGPLAIRVVVGLVALLVAGACSNDRGALLKDDDAGQRRADRAGDGGLATGAADDIVSLYSDLDADGACVRCMRDACGEAERTCLQDARCTQQAQCEARCRDPACMMLCPEYVVGTGLYFTRSEVDAGAGPWDRLPSRGPERPSGCRRRACAEPCRVGRVLDCVGQFNWGQLPAGDQVAVTLFATVAEPWPASVSARHCEGRAERCEDAAGVTLERAALEDLPAGLGLFGPGTFVTTTLTRTGFFELDAQGYDSHLHHPLITPVDRAPLVFAPLVAPELWAAGFAAFGVEDDPAYGLLNIDTYDCLLDRAPELSFSVSPPPTNSDSVSYFDQPPTPGLDRTVQSGTGGVALVDPGLLDVRAVHAETREVIAREHVWARAGARTYLHLVPRSSSDPP